MAVKKTNTRITITLSKKQYNWLVDLSLKKGLKISKLIAWLLWQKSSDVESTKKLLEKPEEAIQELEEQEEISDAEMVDIINSINHQVNREPITIEEFRKQERENRTRMNKPTGI